MLNSINILYISLTGNTKDFIRQLEDYYKEKKIKIHAKNVKEIVKTKQPYEKLSDPFVTFLPSFLEGGNGIENGYQEILTTPLRDYLTFSDNYQKCYGIIGSGNRNFNKQFALTAHQYADHFGFPYLDEFELRGTAADIKRIGDKLIELQIKARKKEQHDRNR
ncbi:class Ib ribonucleoside-diphosphate reductase assembly flavoprotein NrdI [Enterococcus xiangfangensis]|uniref:Class Ib ribonucleoside-diphosphate reductase assembly flavoprotein NrdI n=1 Tax=Enterococcus xiangfangensis TaxID=1296537 RepID=A0ABU3F8Z5_9ENTE|nr:class Ib ribonucleoside-diphosphate reductase assembly flavoprotein NrdI [Enterococcus xiangfangensis]MBM7711143.1 protein involved in ribonucleotide reduction [Enterococcus xiangfangensis]MDT2759149.1 class Ib ribonucleoside-diphosphate reductase assembly flavoprotein NrdI [Enterococcus xiangfangensis]NBK07686.1 ribonucleotide reductase assembly protein NrdI [Enterococcus asini]